MLDFSWLPTPDLLLELIYFELPVEIRIRTNQYFLSLGHKSPSQAMFMASSYHHLPITEGNFIASSLDHDGGYATTTFASMTYTL